MQGNDHGEAYTAIVWGGLLSRESSNPAEAEAVSVAFAAPQPLGRLGQQMLREIMRALFGAQFRLQHMLAADAFRKAGGRGLDVDTVQHLVEQHAVDAAPHPPQLERRCLPQLGDVDDAGAVQPLLWTWA